MSGKGRGIHLKNITQLIKLSIIFLTVFSFAVGTFSIVVWTDNQLRQIEKQTQFLETMLTHNLGSMEGTMRSEILYDEMLIGYAGAVNEVQAINYERELRLLLSSWKETYDLQAEFMLYFTGKDKMIYSEMFLGSNEKEQNRNAEFRRLLSEDGEGGFIKGKWNICQLGSEEYLVKYYHYRTYYLCCYISVNSLVRYYSQYDEREYNLYLVDQTVHGQELSAPLSEAIINKKDGTKIVFLSPQGLFTKKYLKDSNFYFGLIPRTDSYSNGILAGLTAWCVVCFLVSVGGMILLRYVRRSIVQPIFHFVADIESLRDDISYHITNDNAIAELDDAGKLLEELARNLESLRIEAYEKELGLQKIRLDYQTLISKPHFYINCLNTIYAMADMKQNESIQELCRYVSDYVRYLFHSSDSMVALSDELDCLESYLAIQKRRYEDGIQIHTQVMVGLKGIRIPPFLIMTFIENALYHAADPEQCLKIHLNISRDADGFLRLRIEDSGQGFAADVLHKLNNRIGLTDRGRHIGITNILERLAILYGGREDVHFANSELGGAVVEISIPADPSSE